eukprot:CAMPEP_0172208548 /NCGR_PEP_ID=MMETSP1050-20130122/34538_1 /TAXON_ID=233186 /ORGANISM="Cryptomonas curvata, Strain CCAP979/52" /LENGTH=271 /DNA_ID=CAMNT_0012888161 /DNA_START=145 /DNA_END=957 /DNA_ORIENTATION=+
MIVPREDIVLFKARRCDKPDINLVTENNKSVDANSRAIRSRRYASHTTGNPRKLMDINGDIGHEDYSFEGQSAGDTEMIFRSDFESDDAENDESKGMKQGAAVGNQAIITIVPDVATHTQLSPKENSRSEPPEQGYWATVPFLDRDTRKTKNDQGLVTGCGDTPDTLKMQFQDGSTWPVPRSAILRFSKRRREEAAQSDGKSNNSHKPVASGQSRARAGGSALAAGVERINWRAKLRQRCIVEVPNPAYGSYGKAPRYENGDELSDEDLQW